MNHEEFCQNRKNFYNLNLVFHWCLVRRKEDNILTDYCLSYFEVKRVFLMVSNITKEEEKTATKYKKELVQKESASTTNSRPAKQ